MSISEFAEDMPEQTREKFDKGDTVRKARAWNLKTYCRQGGTKREVPIGTIGNLISSYGKRAAVQFNNGVYWNLDIREIDLVKSIKGQR